MATLELKRLSALREKLPETRIALVRLLWHEIKPALDRGHHLKAIHQSLIEAGLDIRYKRLSQCITRLRAEEKNYAVPESVTRKTAHANVVVDDTALRKVIPKPTATRVGEKDSHHPLADFRERIARNKVFDFQPGPPDEDKLI